MHKNITTKKNKKAQVDGGMSKATIIGLVIVGLLIIVGIVIAVKSGNSASTIASNIP